jgi:hypothetical protein
MRRAGNPSPSMILSHSSIFCLSLASLPDDVAISGCTSGRAHPRPSIGLLSFVGPTQLR